MKNMFYRRDFMTMLTRAGISIPLLPSILSAKELTDLKQPKRLVIMFTAPGQHGPDWYPDSKISLKPINTRCNGIRLEDIPGSISAVFDERFDRFRHQINLIKGLDIIPQNNIHVHAPYKALDGAGVRDHPTQTIDQFIANSANFYDRNPVVRSLHLMNPGKADGPTLLCHKVGGIPIQPIRSPSLAMTQLFPKVNPKVHEYLLSNYSSSVSNLRLSEIDKRKLEQHLDFLKNMNQQSNSNCTQPNQSNGSSDGAIIGDFVEIVSSAIKCDLSRVLVLQMTETGDLKILPQFPNRPGYHFLLHAEPGNNAVEQFQIMQEFHAGFVIRMLENLSEVENPVTGATYLDNTLVLWIGEQGVRLTDVDINASHLVENMPMFMAGNINGYFKTGNYLDFTRYGIKKLILNNSKDRRLPCSEGQLCYFDDNYPFIGIPYSQVLVTIMRSMGLAFEEFENQDGGGFGSYLENHENQYDISNRRRLIDEIVA